MEIKVKIKRLSENAVIPKYAHPTDAGMDLVVTRIENDKVGHLICHTDIAVEIPEGYVGLVFPRSSIFMTYLDFANCVGVIDSGYRGEITMIFHTQYDTVIPKNCNSPKEMFNELYGQKLDYDVRVIHNWSSNIYKVGDRIGQLIIMPYPKVEFEEVSELSESDRGTGGYGSTGK